MRRSSDIAVVGLGVMGANLALNLADSGRKVTVYDRATSAVDDFLSGEASPKDIAAADTLESMVASLSSPRVLLLMVKAGSPIDELIASLVPLLDTGDIVIDAGNSHYVDTVRRAAFLRDIGIRFLGVGVSGGEVGARYGPSIMAGGDARAWPHVEALLGGVAAKTPDGTPCCAWMGADGAGHFVKTVHNGIEYGAMQVIAEAYDLMRRGVGMEPWEIGEVFAGWNEGRLGSYLIEITADILRATDNEEPLIDQILDAAEQKGTGMWAVAASMELGEPSSVVAEAVYARIVSTKVDWRTRNSATFDSPVGQVDVSTADLEAALYASRIVIYSQGFGLLAAASKAHQWELDLASVATIWRDGCIIRATILDDILASFETGHLTALTDSDFFANAVKQAEDGWRRVVETAVRAGVPVPAHSAALAYYDGMRSNRLPASLIQAQRDYFGAHAFERVDRPRGEVYHHEWSEQ